MSFQLGSKVIFCCPVTYDTSGVTLLTGMGQLLMFQKDLRDVISMVPHRCTEANNPHVDNYDESKPTSYIQY